MTISKRQFDYLTAMDIELWQQKQAPSTATRKSDQSIKNSLFFSDICIAASCEQSNVTQQNHQWIFPNFTWIMNPDGHSINWQEKNKTLITPELSTCSKSATLKRELWRIIATTNQ